MREGDVPLGEKIFHLTKAEAEPMIQPDDVVDNFRGGMVTLIAGCLNFHHASLPKAG
jgi:hypothetical protein